MVCGWVLQGLINVQTKETRPAGVSLVPAEGESIVIFTSL